MSRTPQGVWAAIAAGKARLAAEQEALLLAEHDDQVGAELAEREDPCKP